MTLPTTPGQLSASDVIAVSSAVIALCAFGATFWQSYLIWKHNKLSVRPHLEIVVKLLSDGPCSIELKNGGLGPAILDEIVFTRGSANFKIVKLDDYKLPLNDFLSLAKPDWDIQPYEPDEYTAIASGQILQLFEASTAQDKQKLMNLFEKCLKGLSLTIRYRSMYGDKFTAAMPSLCGAA